MTIRSSCALTAMLGFMFAAPFAGAQDAPASPSVTAAKAQKTVDARVDGQAIVCKREDTTGTRLGAKRVCHTRDEWAAEAMYSKQSAEHIQNSVTFH